MYAAYLTHTEDHKQFFVAVRMRSFTTKKGVKKTRPEVLTAWGTISTVADNKTYDGPVGSRFADLNHAMRYARKVVERKKDENGYIINWSSDSVKQWPRVDYPIVIKLKLSSTKKETTLTQYTGEVPAWWNDIMVTLKQPKAAPPATVGRVAFDDPTSFGNQVIDPLSKRAKDKGSMSAKTAERMAKLKALASDGEEDEDDPTEVVKEVKRDKLKSKRKPRFSYVPR